MTTIALNPAPAEDTETGQVPHNIDAEQQLLGAILSSNYVMDRIDQVQLKKHHFYDPVHADIFEKAATRIASGHPTDATTLKTAMADHPGLAALGGPEYLLRLQLSAVATTAAPEYARLIHDLAVRRELIDLGRRVTDRAQALRDDIVPDDQIVTAEAELFQLAASGRWPGVALNPTPLIMV